MSLTMSLLPRWTWPSTHKRLNVSRVPWTTSSNTCFWLRETHRFMWSSAHQTPACSRLRENNVHLRLERERERGEKIKCTHRQEDRNWWRLDAKAKSSDSMTDLIWVKHDSKSARSQVDTFVRWTDARAGARVPLSFAAATIHVKCEIQ